MVKLIGGLKYEDQFVKEWPQGRTYFYVCSMLFIKGELHQVITDYSQQYAAINEIELKDNGSEMISDSERIV